MPLFWKKHTDPLPVPQLPEAEDKKSAEHHDTKTEASARPEISATEIKKYTTERIAKTNCLNAEQVTTLQEQRRLALVRLESVQKQIDQAYERERMHRQYVDAKARHEQAQQDVYAKTRNVAALREQEQHLHRFETCEKVLPLYITLLEKEQQEKTSRVTTSRLNEQVRILQSEADKLSVEAEAALNAKHEAEALLSQREEALATGFTTDGLRQAIADEQKQLGSLCETIKDIRQRCETERSEKEKKLQELSEVLSKERVRIAPYDANRQTMEQSDVLLLRLDQLQALSAERDEIRLDMGKYMQRQNDLNSRLTTMFQKEQTMEEQLATLHAEIDMHRAVNQTVDGQALQIRVMEMRSRRQKLLAAQSKWNMICKFHDTAEELRRRIRSLQLTTERETGEIATLELHTSTLSSDAAQKRYDYTLSKGQNVMKMREDLREGIPCAVCGATTHPFHTDQIVEQTKMIAEWKTEADQIEDELTQSRALLLSKQIENAQHRQESATLVEELHHVNAILETLSQEWDNYADTDNSLHGCTPATMSVSRAQTLCGLIENCQRDEEADTERLRTYNFHQKAINNLQQSIDNIDNERHDLHTRLTEANTECQVLVAHSEWLRESEANVARKYKILYEVIDRTINISDWHDKWLASHDRFRSMLRDDSNEWRRLRQQIIEHEKQCANIKLLISHYERFIEDVDTIEQQINRRVQDIEDADRKARGLLSQLFGGKTTMQISQQSRENLDERTKTWQTADREKTDALHRLAMLSGELKMSQQYSSQFSNEVSIARGNIDDWLLSFRMEGNPPCRIEELQELFSDSNDWQQIRENVRQVRQEYDISCFYETQLRNTLLSLEEAENSDSENFRTALMHRRRDILLLIADIDHKLSLHEKAVKYLSENS